MDERYEIHGRVVERHGEVIVRDETRRASTQSLDEAAVLARSFVDGGMVAWVYAVRQEPDRPTPIYRTVEHLKPSAGRRSGVPRTTVVPDVRGAGGRFG